MDNRISETGSSTTRFTPGVWKMHVAISLIGLFIICIVGYGFYAGDRINTVDASMVRAAMKIKLEASTTNLVIEGLLGDGFVADFEPIWEPLDSAFRNFRSIFDESKKRITVLPFQADTVDSDDIENLLSKLSIFKDKARKRFANKRISFLDEEVDRIYRRAFKDLLKDLDTLENSLRRLMSNNLLFFRYSQTAMLALCILMTILAALMFQRFQSARAKAYFSLQKANEQLENEGKERERSAKALRASEERFRQLAENIMDVFWLEDVREPQEIVYVSPTFELWWGRKPNDVYNDNSIFWHIVHHEDRQRVLQSYRNFIRDAGQFDSKFRIVLPDNSIRWIRSRGFPIRDNGGKMYRVAGLAQDISVQKGYEERQEQLIEELKNFSTTISHDLRAPLINLKGFSKEIRAACDVMRPVIETALASLGGESKKALATAFHDDIPEAINYINSAVSKMERLIKAILTLSRFGRRELLLEALDMNNIIQDTLKSLAYQIKAGAVNVSVGSIPEIIADKVSMEQIFSNLLGNAVNYLDPGRAGEIEITAESRMGETVFHIRDTGRGIKNADLKKVFNMFERLGNDSVAGEGMGLAYVQALVRRHEGEINCESEYGVGTKFTFTISKRLNLHEDIEADSNTVH